MTKTLEDLLKEHAPEYADAFMEDLYYEETNDRQVALLKDAEINALKAAMAEELAKTVKIVLPSLALSDKVYESKYGEEKPDVPTIYNKLKETLSRWEEIKKVCGD